MDQDLLKRYFDDQCSHSEVRQVLEWFQTSEGQQYLDEELDRDIRFLDEWGAAVEYPNIDSDALFDRIEKGRFGAPNNQRVNNRQSRSQWKKAAAIILIAGIMSLFIGIIQSSRNTEKIAKADTGEKKTLRLPDNSKIVLHSNSTVKYLSDFENREVILEGEAYFEVEHNENKPFIVYVDNSYVKVLGTKFIVHGYSSGERVEVAVKSGRVELGSRLSGNGDLIKEHKVPGSEGQYERVLIENEQVGVQNKNSSPFITDSTYSDEVFDWLNNMMIFRNTPLTRVMNELEKRYGVQCILQDSTLASQKLTSSFDDESLPQVLKVITLSLDIDYKKVGDKIYFSE